MPITIEDKIFTDFKSAVENKQETIVIDPRGEGAIPNTLDDNGQPNIIDYSNKEPLLFGLGENSSHEYPGKIVINNESRYVDRAVKRETIPNVSSTGEGSVGANVTQPTLPTGASQPGLEVPDHNMHGMNFNDKINWNETTEPLIQIDKFTKQETQYTDFATKEDKCVKCVHFVEPNHCEIVGSPGDDIISPIGWCDKFHIITHLDEAVKLDPMAGDLKQSLPISQAFSDTGNNVHIVPEVELDPNAEKMYSDMDYTKLGKPFNEKSDTGDDLTRTGPGGAEPSNSYNIKRYESSPGDIKLNIATPYYDGKAPHNVSGIVPELQDKNETLFLIPNELKEDIQITKVHKKEEDSKDLYALLIAAGLITLSLSAFLKAMKKGNYKQIDELKDIISTGTEKKLIPYDFMRFQYNRQENCPICKPLDNLEFWVDDPARPIVPSENLGAGVFNTHPNCKCSNIPFIKLLSENKTPKSDKGKSKVTRDSLAERKRITQEYLRPLNEAVNYREKSPAEFSWIDSSTINEMQKHAEQNKPGRFILAVVSGESYTDHRIEGTEKHRRHWTEDEMRQNIRTGKGKLIDINHLVPKKDPYSGGIFDANWNETTKKGEMILFETDQEILNAIRTDIIGAVSINTGPPRTIELNCNTGECLLEPKGTHLGNHKGVALSYVVTSPKGFTYNGQWLYPLPPGMKFTKIYLVE